MAEGMWIHSGFHAVITLESQILVPAFWVNCRNLGY